MRPLVHMHGAPCVTVPRAYSFFLSLFHAAPCVTTQGTPQASAARDARVPLGRATSHPRRHPGRRPSRRHNRHPQGMFEPAECCTAAAPKWHMHACPCGWLQHCFRRTHGNSHNQHHVAAALSVLSACFAACKPYNLKRAQRLGACRPRATHACRSPPPSPAANKYATMLYPGTNLKYTDIKGSGNYGDPLRVRDGWARGLS